jgi:bifunctional non-homologous end joining protein LigD
VTETEIDAGDRRVRLTHPDKVLFPEDGITKRDLAEYYVRVAEVMVPHIRDRPLTQHRWPDGTSGQDFWHKQIPGYFPDWIRRVKVRTNKGPQEQVLGNDGPTLAYLSNQNCITPHVWLSRKGRLAKPDLIIFDLDPASDRDFAAVRAGARTLRGLLQDLDLVPFVKTTGSKGLHVTVPIEPTMDFDRVHRFAHQVAVRLVEHDPDRFTMEFYKEKRAGRVFVDIGRNAYGQTAVPPYAVRARPRGPVATPVTWEELGRISPSRFTLRNLFRRLSARGDPWRGIHEHARPVPRVATR